MFLNESDLFIRNCNRTKSDNVTRSVPTFEQEHWNVRDEWNLFRY